MLICQMKYRKTNFIVGNGGIEPPFRDYESRIIATKSIPNKITQRTKEECQNHKTWT